MPPEAAIAPLGRPARDDTSPSQADLWLARLQRDGYCIIRGLVGNDLVAGLSADLAERFERTPFCEGVFYGGRTKRFGGVLKRSGFAEAFV
ncbi:MAG: phytanoyl-CoA dioxygenase, partial [Phenylobacterium sp.]|nr:phytanoyl-CoA dioxygenase [Phenylobacterium sp.]